MTTPKPFTINIDSSVIDGILAKVKAYEWIDMPEIGKVDLTSDLAWMWGTPVPYMKEVADYWVSEYDWSKAEANLNKYPHFIAEVDGTDIHYVHAKADNPKGLPILISHGWPGSFYEFWDVIDELNAAGHDVIVPSLIGYGFSGRPKTPVSPRTIAGHFAKLATEVLGLDAYIAQGGDWGSMVTAFQGYEEPACKGIHMNMMGWMPPGIGPETEEEQAAAAHSQMRFDAEGAYFRIQSSRPISLSYGMMDSPVGVAAWILEKFRVWSDVPDGNLESVYTKDQLLTNIMIYLVTRSFNTSVWIYNGLFSDLSGDPISEGARIEKPVGIASFPGDTVYMFPPRSQVERSCNVVHWTDMKEGGHFAAMEKPALFAADLLAYIDSAGL